MPPLVAVQRCALSALLLAVVMCVSASPAAFAADAADSPARAYVAWHCANTRATGAGPRQERAILCLVNRERARHGLRRLRRSRALARAAERYARDMSRHNYFAHYSRSGSSPAARVRRAGYRCKVIGENLAFGRGYPGTPAGIVAQWMASAPHRSTLLSPRVRDLGVGAARGVPLPGVHGGITVAAEFARR